MNALVLLHSSAFVFCHDIAEHRCAGHFFGRSAYFFFVIASQSEESSAMWMLRCVQHGKSESVIPSEARNPSLERHVLSGLLRSLCALAMTQAI